MDKTNRIDNMNSHLQPPARRFTVDQIASSKRLPSLPEVALKLVQIAQQEDPNYAEISRIIRSDPVVSGKILKTANSALFGFPQKIETIEDAVPVFGLTMLRTLILSFHLASGEGPAAELKPILQDLWRSSLTQAVFAELLAEKIKGEDPATYFLAAMLQDIGILAMISEAPQEYLSHVLDRAKFPQVIVAERSYFGFSHVDVTAAILQQWGMGDCFGDALQHHHDRVVPPGSSRNSRLAVVLQAASQGTEMMFSSRSSAMSLPAAVVHWASFLQSRLGLRNVDAEQIVSDVTGRVNEYSALFSFDIGAGVCPERVVTEAKVLLQEIALRNQMDQLEQAQSRKKNPAGDDALYRDSLCGLYNRRYMNDKLGENLEQCIEKNQPVAFLFIDVDKFKSINDRFGHATGDKAIQHVAAWLNKSIRKQDIAFRLGGDEFLVVLQNLREVDYESIARRIGNEIPQLELADRTEIKISLSVGCTFYQPENGDLPDPNWLIDQADQAMYKSKRSGGCMLTMQKFIGTKLSPFV